MGRDRSVKRIDHWSLSLYRPCFLAAIQKKKGPRVRRNEKRKIFLGEDFGCSLISIGHARAPQMRGSRVVLESLAHPKERGMCRKSEGNYLPAPVTWSNLSP